jgi:polysaccharide deacetylase 2 family uncharacterized protein YibQ
VTVVIDDVGLDRAGTALAVALPGPLTLSWMPYAHNLAPMLDEARGHGHEALLHMPMQPIGPQDPGPDALSPGLSMAENEARLRDAIAAVPDAIGLNNHMGSRATRDPALMDMVAGMLHADGMLLLDSRTIGDSVALSRAQAAGVPAAARDVFLDNSTEPAAIRTQLAEVEAVARRKGSVIAIGHPHRATMAALAAWLPTLAGKGLVLEPLSAMVAMRDGIE